MEDLLAHASNFHGFKKFDHIQATFVGADKKQAVFDVGGKSEAVVSDDHFREAKDLIKSLKQGEKVHAVVMDPETKEGKILLSLRHAAHEKLWTELQRLFDKNEPIMVTGQTVTDKGITVLVSGLSAFIPTTQLAPEHADNLNSTVGLSFKVQIIELDPVKNRIVLSERAINDAIDQKKLKELMKHVETGKVYKGIVTTVTSFGAFVQIEVDEVPVEGLVHVSEFAWGKTVHPADMLSEGDDVEVVAINTESGKLALSMKQAQADPWETVSEKYHVEDRLKGTVVKHSDFGVFVELEPGIEGLIHMTKIPPSTKLTTGQEVNVYIEEVNIRDHKISLGLVITTSKPIGYK
jgi:ribosomal protein S1